eukprot:scaffold174371_cov17-Tisochrysis_lutea.AAC.1
MQARAMMQSATCVCVGGWVGVGVMHACPAAASEQNASNMCDALVPLQVCLCTQLHLSTGASNMCDALEPLHLRLSTQRQRSTGARNMRDALVPMQLQSSMGANNMCDALVPLQLRLSMQRRRSTGASSCCWNRRQRWCCRWVTVLHATVRVASRWPAGSCYCSRRWG